MNVALGTLRLCILRTNIDDGKIYKTYGSFQLSKNHRDERFIFESVYM